MKKAQVAEEVFIFILAVFLAAGILIYGYNAISGFVSTTENIAVVKFESDLNNAVKSIAFDYGTVKKLDLGVPSTYKKLCFVQLDYASAQSSCICSDCGNGDYAPLICDAWNSPGNKQSAFLVPMANAPINLAPIQVDSPVNQGYICFPITQGTVTIRLEGLGDKTKIGAWS